MEAARENQQPLLPESVAPTNQQLVSTETVASLLLGKQPKTPTQKAMRKTFKGSAHLANLLPTGTVLVFQILSPVVTDQGRCPNATSRGMTLCVIVLSALSCFFCSFTDSVRDSRGKVRYGLATFKGLYVLDSSVVLSPEETTGYRLRLIDFFHAITTSLVFGVVALFDQKVVKCFYPSPSKDAREMLVALPAFVGIVCSLFFIMFPTKRHGIGFPLSKQ